MRLILVADAFPPMDSSASIQLWDLAVDIKRLGHDIWVIVPSYEITNTSFVEIVNEINILRLQARKTKDINYINRAINEFLLPILMIRNYQISKIKDYQWDGVIWYSPTIFLGLFAWYLKRKNRCKTYLILRDIFPRWALDLGLIKKGPFYFILKIVETFQYWVADTIGIQSDINMKLMSKWNKSGKRKVELLNNWLANHPNIGCSISIDKTSLAGRKIFVYAGNMGVAQNVNKLINLADKFKDNHKIGFLFVGRGEQLSTLKRYATYLNLKNLLFFDEIPNTEIPGLYSQCFIGLISLDSRHKTSNIPGKFISYMQSGLPAFALVNPDNDLINIINENSLGLAVTDIDDENIRRLVSLIENCDKNSSISENCKNFYKNNYSVSYASNKIVSNLQYRCLKQ